MAIAYELDLLPVTNGEPFEVGFELSSTYWFNFRWNGRVNLWLMDVADPAKDPMYHSVAMVLNYSLLSRFSDDRRPPGKLILKDLSGKNLRPGPNDLGDRCKLYYVI